MKKRREIKKAARRNYRRNFVPCFLALLMFVFLFGGTISFSETIAIDKAILEEIEKNANGTAIEGVIHNVLIGIEDVRKATSIGEASHAGVISAVYRSSLKAGGVNNALLSLVNGSVFGGKFSKESIGFVGGAFTLIFNILIGGAFNIGIYRLFLETRVYPGSQLTRILFVYRNRYVKHIAGIVFTKYLRLFLWAFTIVGFPIKFYSYYLVPMIAAEMPDMPRKQVFILSENMARGYRFRIFLFDLSFWGWKLLSIFTFGLLDYLWLNPYVRAAKAELYAVLREAAKENRVCGAELLTDEPLFTPYRGTPPEGYEYDVYPTWLPERREMPARRWINIGAKEHYSLLNLSLMFFLFSFIGWIWECMLVFIESGVFVNRGTLYGPWIPIYGLGGVLILLLLNRLNKKPVVCFFVAMAICGVVEYLGATLLWNLRHIKYWDYSGYFFNIQGRVCLEGLLTFGLLGMMGLYLIAPLTDNLLNKAPMNSRKLACTTLFAVFGADFVLSQIHPHVGPGITSKLK
ncbi:MAG: DUF975 family protein [Clostridiales Family XIII bacterium]|jgi:hypothetical protein|nr:DUF975 family protein [Clostridiales Family XIII bacterium]